MRSNDCRRGIHWRCTSSECVCSCSHNESDTTEAEFDRMWDEAKPATAAPPSRNDDLATGIVLGAIFL